MSVDCTYCGCDAATHDPVTLVEGVDADGTAAGTFCNYGCLAAHVETNDLVAGTACSVEVE